MAQLRVVGEKGEEVKEIEVPLGQSLATTDSLAQAVRVFQTNRRKYPAMTKTRGEVAGGGRKPWRQKGTGRARQGSTRSPIWRGGGVSHGPRGEGGRLRLNRRAGKSILASLLTEKISNGKITLLVDTLRFAKARDFSKFLLALGINQQRSLFLAAEASEFRRIRNVKMVRFASLSNFNVLDLLRSDDVLISESNFVTLRKRFGL